MTSQAYPEKSSSKTFTKGKESIIFIKHISEGIKDIEFFSKGISKQGMFKDKQKQYAIIRAIEIIGEAVPSQIKEKELVGARCKKFAH